MVKTWMSKDAKPKVCKGEKEVRTDAPRPAVTEKLIWKIYWS